jgi:hypothetical protein
MVITSTKPEWPENVSRARITAEVDDKLGVFALSQGNDIQSVFARTQARDFLINMTYEVEQKYRRELWLHHGHTGLYGDDGEMQCTKCPPGVWDYKRQPLEDVERAAFEAKVLKLGTELDSLRGQWKPIALAQENGSWVELLCPSGSTSTPFRTHIARLNHGVWRDHANDLITDYGDGPTHFREWDAPIIFMMKP